MPRKKLVPPAVKKSSASASKTPIRRPPQTGARERIIELIAAGPITNAQLLAKGHFTPSNLFVHLKRLTAEKLIERRLKGREAEYLLRAVKPKPAVLEGELIVQPKVISAPKSNAIALAGDTYTLDTALEKLSRKLAPVDDLDKKLRMLNRLAQDLPGPVGELLNLVMNDLARLGS